MAAPRRTVLRVSAAERFFPLLPPACLLWLSLSDTGRSRVVGLTIGMVLLALLGIPAARGGTELSERGVRLYGSPFAVIPWTVVRAVHPTGRSTRRGELGLHLEGARTRPLPGSRIEDLALVRDWVARHRPQEP